MYIIHTSRAALVISKFHRFRPILILGFTAPRLVFSFFIPYSKYPTVLVPFKVSVCPFYYSFSTFPTVLDCRQYIIN